MRKPMIILVPLAACSLLLAGAQIAGAAGNSNTTSKVRIVMHDPGCHWFSVGGKLKTKLSVPGPVALTNLDEAALKIVGPHATRFEAVGKTITLSRGSYRITMVHQHADDNTLKLIIS